MGKEKLKKGDRFKFEVDQDLLNLAQETGDRITISRDAILEVIGTYETEEGVWGIRAISEVGEYVNFHQKTSEGLEAEGLEVSPLVISKHDKSDETEDESDFNYILKSQLASSLVAGRQNITLQIPKGDIDVTIQKIKKLFTLEHNIDGREVVFLSSDQLEEALKKFKADKEKYKIRNSSDSKKRINTLYVWINPDEINFSREQHYAFIHMAKYTHFMLMFDHNANLNETLFEVNGEYAGQKITI